MTFDFALTIHLAARSRSALGRDGSVETIVSGCVHIDNTSLFSALWREHRLLILRRKSWNPSCSGKQGFGSSHFAQHGRDDRWHGWA